MQSTDRKEAIMFSRIVSDSSSNVFAVDGLDYTTVPLKIHTDEKEYVDTPALDVDGMIEDLRRYKGKSTSSCPNIFDWTQAFGDAEQVFCLTISGNLSGSYSAAMQAGSDYMNEHPGRKVAVFDSQSTGPKMQLIIEKIRECEEAGMDFETATAAVREYKKHIHTLFCLQSLANLARNGRVSQASAKLAGVLGIRVIGKASDHGTLEPQHKCRGERKALDTLLSEIKLNGFSGGKLRIAHCQNPESADALQNMVLAAFPGSDIEIVPCTALCSFYAERGGLIIGYEGK